MNGLVLKGEAGNIEAEISGAAGNPRGALLCHPHPLYGGSMDDSVLAALTDSLIDENVSVLRFNFRGVGASDGQHAEGVGETQDVIQLCNWFRKEHSLEQLILGGYSFGAGIALAAASQATVESLILVAPPLQMIKASPIPEVPLLVILGEQDQIVDNTQAIRHFRERASWASIVTIADADHFFMGHLDLLATQTRLFLARSPDNADAKE